MARINSNVAGTRVPEFTHEGAVAARITPVQELRRSVLATLLWEDTFYESGVDIATRIKDTAAKVDKDTVANLAVEARTVHGLRHVPLLLLTDLIKRGGTGVADAITNTVSRVDEITELAAIYWKFNPGKDFSAQMKKGLGQSFNKFNEYQFAKYNRDTEVKLRDVLFLTHPKAKSVEQQELFNKIVNNTLATPDTWEVNLSAGNDKKETFERLIREGKLGYLALLRNLRNMEQAGVDRDLVIAAIKARKGADLVFPFRYVAAARAAPSFANALDKALIEAVTNGKKLPGKTIVVVDTSGSMYGAPVSSKSDIDRVTAAATLASVINGDDVRILAFGTTVRELPHRLGLAGVESITKTSLGGTNTRLALDKANEINKNGNYDRLILITDEQSRTSYPKMYNFKHKYVINVANYKNGLGYGDGWVHIDGFSEAVIKYIFAYEEAGF